MQVQVTQTCFRECHCTQHWAGRTCELIVCEHGGRAAYNSDVSAMRQTSANARLQGASCDACEFPWHGQFCHEHNIGQWLLTSGGSVSAWAVSGLSQALQVILLSVLLCCCCAGLLWALHLDLASHCLGACTSRSTGEPSSTESEPPACCCLGCERRRPQEEQPVQQQELCIPLEPCERRLQCNYGCEQSSYVALVPPHTRPRHSDWLAHPDHVFIS